MYIIGNERQVTVLYIYYIKYIKNKIHKLLCLPKYYVKLIIHCLNVIIYKDFLLTFLTSTSVANDLLRYGPPGNQCIVFNVSCYDCYQMCETPASCEIGHLLNNCQKSSHWFP